MVLGLVVLLVADEGELAGVQPIAAAGRAFIDFNAPSRAEEMAHHDDMTTRALAATREVDPEVFAFLDMNEELAGSIGRIIELLELKGIKPNTSAAAQTNIDGHRTGLDRGEFSVADWTFHKPTLIRDSESRKPTLHTMANATCDSDAQSLMNSGAKGPEYPEVSRVLPVKSSGRAQAG